METLAFIDCNTEGLGAMFSSFKVSRGRLEAPSATLPLLTACIFSCKTKV